MEQTEKFQRWLEESIIKVEEEIRQLESNMRAWRTRLEQFERDLAQEPQRIRAFYEVRAKRIEPVGLVYLWPETH